MRQGLRRNFTQRAMPAWSEGGVCKIRALDCVLCGAPLWALGPVARGGACPRSRGSPGGVHAVSPVQPCAVIGIPLALMCEATAPISHLPTSKKRSSPGLLPAPILLDQICFQQLDSLTSFLLCLPSIFKQRQDPYGPGDLDSVDPASERSGQGLKGACRLCIDLHIMASTFSLFAEERSKTAKPPSHQLFRRRRERHAHTPPTAAPALGCKPGALKSVSLQGSSAAQGERGVSELAPRG